MMLLSIVMYIVIIDGWVLFDIYCYSYTPTQWSAVVLSLICHARFELGIM